MARNTFEETDARIAADLIAALDKHAENPIGWKMPWNVSATNPGNPITGRSYSGSYNAVVLMFAAMKWGGDQRFAGFGQWRKDGRPVKRAKPACRFSTLSSSAPLAVSRGIRQAVWRSRRLRRGVQEAQRQDHGRIRGEQGLQQPADDQPPPGSGHEGRGPGGRVAAVTPLSEVGRGPSARGWARVLQPFRGLHSGSQPGRFQHRRGLLVHGPARVWALDRARFQLAREGITRPDGYSVEAYAYEELVAEIAASFLCKHVGVERPGLDERTGLPRVVAQAAGEDPAIIRRRWARQGRCPLLEVEEAASAPGNRGFLI